MLIHHAQHLTSGCSLSKHSSEFWGVFSWQKSPYLRGNFHFHNPLLKNTTMSHTSYYINWRQMPSITRGRTFWVLHCKQAILSEETGWTIPSVSNSRYLLHWQFPAEEIISFRGRNFCIRKSPQSLGSSITCGTEESVLTFRMVLCPSTLVMLLIYKYASVISTWLGALESNRFCFLTVLCNIIWIAITSADEKLLQSLLQRPSYRSLPPLISDPNKQHSSNGLLQPIR